MGAKVGIAVGAIVFCLITAGCFIVCRGKRRRRAHLQKLAKASFHGPAMTDRYNESREFHNPQSNNNNNNNNNNNGVFAQQQTYPWQAYGHQNESPVSSMGEASYFSPYTSNYNSPVSPQVGRNGQMSFPTGISVNEKMKGVVHDGKTQGDEIEMNQLHEANDR
ncbi:MAG: hypothetical protein M1818_000191 [Claussenomyces sp. TS43310]|nr:MAG: hypothetical protein M1818_000191 [Claussenomyces sp. TS43310]